MGNKLPEHIREVLLRVGEVDWCALEDGTPEQLGKAFQQMVENTHKTHGLEPVQTCHYVGTEDGRLSIAMVGTSPSSGTISSIITAGWNMMWAQAKLEELQITEGLEKAEDLENV